MSIHAAHLRCFAVLVLTAMFLAVATSTHAAAPTIQIEQDWELVLGDPDTENDAPQIVCVISPQADTDSVHAVVELNQQTLPSFSPGGIQLQIWDGEMALGGRNACDAVALTNPNEKITWTLRMSLADGALTFAVLNGNSPTWGAFGGHGSLAGSISTTTPNLDGYDPAVSIKNSGANFATNRVLSMTLKRSRYYSADGTVREDAVSTEVPIHQ